MKISFAITVCNELEEIKRLIPFLLENKRVEDEIVILYDEKNGNSEVIEFLLPYNKLPNVQTWRGFGFEGNFANWKNKLNSYCTGDYIYQIDADEMISEYMVKHHVDILEMNTDIDLIYVPRINTVDGLTDDDIKINISDNEHIASIISVVLQGNPMTDELKIECQKKLYDAGYDKEKIDEWINIDE